MTTSLIKLNDRTCVNQQFVVMVALNNTTLKTAVFLSNGVAVETDFTFEETVKLFEK